MKKRCICTIICSNYVAYARTLHESICRAMKGVDYYVLILDSNMFNTSCKEEFNIILPSQLKINDFREMAFIYDRLELSTNVKPALLKHLISMGYQEVLYLDPDIYIYKDLEFIFNELDNYSIILTPHSLSPYNEDGLRPSDQDLLLNGIFNLGFIGVDSGDISTRFLNWWELKCKKLGFREQRSGLMVDQKWINLVPCYYDRVKILKHPGCNVAYWNLHERSITLQNGNWYVNGNQPLIFFHFSGLLFDNSKNMSKYQNRYSIDKEEEIKNLYNSYNAALFSNGIKETINMKYIYDYYDNGDPISLLARRMYGYHCNICNDDPFNSKGAFYEWAKRNRLIAYSKSSDKYSSMNYNSNDLRLKVIHLILKYINLLFGVDKYTMLLKYLNYISSLRNQHSVFAFKKNNYENWH